MPLSDPDWSAGRQLLNAVASQYGALMFALGGRQQLLRVVLVLGAVDWSLTVAGVNRPVAVPLLVTAAGTVLLATRPVCCMWQGQCDWAGVLVVRA